MMGARLDQSIAILNGLLGDYLQREGNGLALQMELRRDGKRVEASQTGLAAAYADATPRAVVFVHGVMCDEGIWRFPDGGDYGQRLQRDLGITPLYVRYNSGLSIADNGEALDALLDSLVACYPIPLHELILVGFSMGGLLVRSACHHASMRESLWLPQVKRAIYVGTPHAGAPAERWGRLATRVLRSIPDPYTRLIGQIADLRSAGVKDLGDADLRHEDRASTSNRMSLRDRRHPVPLLPGIEHSLIAGSLSVEPAVASLLGDGIVPLTSAQGCGAIALSQDDISAAHVCVLAGRSHLDLAHDDEAYVFIRTWCEEER